jgi:hypothetical protein
MGRKAEINKGEQPQYTLYYEMCSLILGMSRFIASHLL